MYTGGELRAKRDMKIFGEILHRPMTRGDFLRTICMIAFAAFGIGNFIAAVSKQNRIQNSDSTIADGRSSHGFGSSKFGI